MSVYFSIIYTTQKLCVTLVLSYCMAVEAKPHIVWDINIVLPEILRNDEFLIFNDVVYLNYAF